MKARVDYILTERLLELYDPWAALGVKPEQVSTPTQDQFIPHHTNRDLDYDLGRIAFFRDYGFEDPLELDNICESGRIYPLPNLVDGHHRLCGAALAKRERVPAIYGGRVDLLNWLKGCRKTPPTDTI